MAKYSKKASSYVKKAMKKRKKGTLKSGSGRKVATAAGAAAGGYAGNRIQNRMQEGNTYTTTEQRCETVYDSHEKQVGFDVRYRLGETEGSVQMDRDPGERIPVKDGQLVLAQPEVVE